MEEKDSFGVSQFVSGFPPSLEVQGVAELLAFHENAEGVWPFQCRHSVALSCK